MKLALPFTIVLDTWDAFSDDSLGGAFGFRLSTAQRLDSCLWEVQQAMERATLEAQSNGLPPPRWILKPSATNKGAEANRPV